MGDICQKLAHLRVGLMRPFVRLLRFLLRLFEVMQRPLHLRIGGRLQRKEADIEDAGGDQRVA